jgi:hypothetical protein
VGVPEKHLRALFNIWSKRLGLGHWTIEVVVEKIKPRTTSMRTSKSLHYDRGRITVQPWVLTGDAPPDWHPAPGRSFKGVVEETVVHELLHLLLWETSSAICLLHQFSKKSAYGAAVTVQEHQEEGMVDRLSVALVRAWHARGNAR